MSLTEVIGNIPYRLALAGGWIDQPFISRLLKDPPGSMVVVGIEPTCRFMERSGLATGTRRAALKLWKTGLPKGEPDQLVKALYDFENQNQTDPSGSQDMIGLFYPGVSRLDYDINVAGGVFPKHIENVVDAGLGKWIENVIHLLPVEPRPMDYSPLGVKNLDPIWATRLGQTGKDCFNALLARDARALGESMNTCMACWEALLPHTVRHPTLRCDLMALLGHYQKKYPGAMYSGCGGGYLYVVSEEPVPGALKIKVRLN
jgi:hypothetical protein